MQRLLGAPDRKKGDACAKNKELFRQKKESLSFSCDQQSDNT